MAVILMSDGVTVVEAADAFTTNDPWVDHDDWACSTPESTARQPRGWIGHSVTQTLANFGFSRPVFYVAQAALTRGGLPALVQQRPGLRHRHKVRPEILSFLRQVRLDEPTARLGELAERVEARFGVRLHPRTIERVLGPRPKPHTLPLPRAPTGPLLM